MEEKDKRNLLKILNLLIKDDINNENTKDFFKENSKILDRKKIQSIIDSLDM